MLDLSTLQNVNIEETILYSIKDVIIENRGSIEVLEKYTSRVIFTSNHHKDRHSLILKRIKMQLCTTGEEFIKYLKATQNE